MKSKSTVRSLPWLHISAKKSIAALSLTALLLFQSSSSQAASLKIAPTATPASTAGKAPTSTATKSSTAAPTKAALHATALPTDCDYTVPAEPQYKATPLAMRKKGVVAKGELFEVQVYLRNEGNTPWFSEDSGCKNMQVNLGTERDRDRPSPFFTEKLLWESHWLSPQRIRMESSRVEPGEMATFTFWGKAPQEAGLYREYLMPVVEGVTWIESGLLHFDIIVEDDAMEPEQKEFLEYIQKSGNLSTMQLEGEKNILVSIGQQKLWLKIGETVIREFQVSTGKYSTPTPRGTTKIMNKQLVRVGAGWPHYIMPHWMQFRAGGYGFHALPSLANDGGIFWREALDHIGTPRSHGCIRMLPNDAEYAYNFTEVGTTVVVGA